MAKKMSAQLDMLQIPVLGFVPEKVSSAPASSPVDGRVYYNTSDNRFYGRENGSFVLLSQTGVQLLTGKNAASGYAGLDGSSKLAIGQIPTGTTGSTVPFGNDARFTDTRTPTDATVTGGPAGAGVKIAALTITHDNIAASTLTLAKFNASATDQAAGTASLRTLGTSSTSAAAGNDSRLSDTRTPTAGSVVGASFNAAVIDPAAGTAGVRTLGYTGTSAMPGIARLDQIAAPTAAVSMNGQRLTGLPAPGASDDPARLSDLQAAQIGIDAKASVRAVATANRATTGLTAIDGVTIVGGDRVLLVNNSAPAENGPWIAAAGAWARPVPNEITSGSFWLVTEGSNAGTQWKVATADPITVGSTSISIVQWGAAGTVYTGTSGRVTVSGGVIDIDAAYVGQTSITTLGTVATGTWSATTIALNKGGTGATTAAAAADNLGVSSVYAVTWGTAIVAGVEFTINHALNTTDTVESFKILSDGTKTDMAVRTIDANNIGVTADVAYSSSAIRVCVQG